MLVEGGRRVMFRRRLQRCVVVDYVDEVREGSRSRERNEGAKSSHV